MKKRVRRHCVVIPVGMIRTLHATNESLSSDFDSISQGRPALCGYHFATTGLNSLQTPHLHLRRISIHHFNLKRKTLVLLEEAVDARMDRPVRRIKLDEVAFPFQSIELIHTRLSSRIGFRQLIAVFHRAHDDRYPIFGTSSFFSTARTSSGTVPCSISSFIRARND